MNIKMMEVGGHRSSLPIVSNRHAVAAEVLCAQRADLKKLASGSQKFLNLSEACRKNCDTLGEVIPKEIRLEVNFSQSGPIIKGDAYHIQQIFTQLVLNACESLCGVPGSIFLTVKTFSSVDIPATHRFPPDWQPKSKFYACFEVADTGRGIEEKDINALFDPFSPDKFKSRSLDLPVILEIVRAHLGAITVESKVGCGSTFRVFLPVSVEKISQPAALLAEALESRAGGTALIVDGDRMLRDLALIAIRSLGYAVLEAKDGFEALEIFRQYRDTIRFVLCDVAMPHMDGWETLAALRQLAPQVPVIMSSIYDLKQTMAGNHAEFPQVFLEKPYGVTALREAIRQVLKA